MALRAWQVDILGWERVAQIVMGHFRAHWNDQDLDVDKPGFEGVRPLLVAKALQWRELTRRRG